MTNSLYVEANQIVVDAIAECGLDRDALQEYVQQSCDGHEVTIYFGKGINFCASNDTSEGEAYLEECGGIAQEGDSFGNIACRIAYATLYVKCLELIEEELV
jgi:hypothetical protein